MLTWVLGGLGVSAAMAALIYYVHRALTNRVALDETSAALRVETDRVSKLEAAQAEARAARAKEFDAQATAVHDAGGAAGLLRSVTDSGDTATH